MRASSSWSSVRTPSRPTVSCVVPAISTFSCDRAPSSSRVVAALRAFGAPLAAHGVSAADFARAGTVYQLGLPPRRIDILTMISGVTFEQAWADSVRVEVGGVGFRVPSRAALLVNKRASGRPKDLEDVRRLELAAAGPEDS
jgi:hypothetical protein